MNEMVENWEIKSYNTKYFCNDICDFIIADQQIISFANKSDLFVLNSSVKGSNNPEDPLIQKGKLREKVNGYSIKLNQSMWICFNFLFFFILIFIYFLSKRFFR
jgi:hypothetical protein